MNNILEELFQFSDSLKYFKFNKEEVRFEKVHNEDIKSVVCMLDIVDFLDSKKIKYSIEDNQNIEVRLQA